jgi:hypothetical protein
MTDLRALPPAAGLSYARAMPGMSSGLSAADRGWPRCRPRTPRFAGGLLGLVVIGACTLSACGGTSSARTNPNPAAIRISLATSVESSAGSWAVAPMGHLDQPLNTFWQLFFRAAGAELWSDRASALAVATNGGLAISSNGRSLAIGIRPTNLLDYSPLIATSNARTWSAAGPIGPLADHPDALALNATGGALALVGADGGDRVLASPGALSGWRVLVTSHQLARSKAGHTCGVTSITAVGYLGSDELVGAACRRAGVFGIFLERQGAWRLVGPGVPAPLAASRADVLGMQSTTAGLCSLTRLTGRRSTDLLTACASGSATHWRLAPAFAVTGPDNVLSSGPAGGSGMFALISGTGSVERLEALDVVDMRWTRLPSPPKGTTTVAFGPSGSVDALAAGVTVCAVWRLAVGASHWERTQQIQVAIQFGSSG